MVAFKHEKEGQANQSENAIFLPLQVDRINTCRVLNRFQPDPKKSQSLRCMAFAESRPRESTFNCGKNLNIEGPNLVRQDIFFAPVLCYLFHPHPLKGYRIAASLCIPPVGRRVRRLDARFFRRSTGERQRRGCI